MYVSMLLGLRKHHTRQDRRHHLLCDNHTYIHTGTDSYPE